MNYRDSQNKKIHTIKINQSSNIKYSTAAIPSKKPPIPHCLLQQTHKKQIYQTNNKQNKKSRDSNQTSIWIQNDKNNKNRFIGTTKTLIQKSNKIEDNKIKKIKKNSFQKNIKQNKYYKYPGQHSESIQRIKKKQFNIQNLQQQSKLKKKFDFHCKQRIKKQKNKKNLNSNAYLYMSSQTLTKTSAQEIAQFKQKTQQIQIQTQSQAITQIVLKENQQYRLDINNIQKKQPNIPWIKRAIVINWMMQTLTDFGSKRQTFAIAVKLLDHYLALSQPILLHQLQTIAVTSMYLANKLQDHIFNVNDICQFTNNNNNKILQYQLKMVIKLKWKLNPPTANMWANRLSIQWDQYIDKYSIHCQLIHQNINKIKFWIQNTDGYYNYRQLMQFIDFSILQMNTLRYHCRDLAASFMYIILNIRLNIYSKQQILTKFQNSSTYLINTSQFNIYFNDFLHNSFGFHLRDILPTVQYCSTFLIIPPCYKLPKILQHQNQQQITYSQFCSLQTCNQNNLPFLNKRDRTYE